VLLVSCGGSGYDYEPPQAATDGWAVASAADVGLDVATLSRLVDEIRDDNPCRIHGILVVKDDRLVFEEYFAGHRFEYEDPEFLGEEVEFDAETRHNLMSVTKAVAAALVGIGIDQGAIEGRDASVIAAFPQYASLRSEVKDAITVEHLLTMTSGLEWNEWDVPLTDTNNDLIQLFLVEDPVEYVLARPVAHEPGTFWYYSGGDVNLLGEYFDAATGTSIDDFSEAQLFGPLGITDYQWRYLTPDVVYTSGELEMRPRDLAKFGSLFLNDGVWNGTQVVSGDWVEASIQEHVSIPGRAADGDGYGYQWFTETYEHDGKAIEAVQRSGWGGQAIVLFQDLDMMVVLTGGDYVQQCHFGDIVVEYVLPAVDWETAALER
jgi:CubicO group peptidase (beta-lactamase class C family)